MLINLLAIAVGLGSLILFSTAFFLPKLHRRDDFFWGSVGLFYALDLWVCRESFRGGVLLGQVASCALLFSLGWQMWRLRVQTPDVQQFSLLDWLSSSLFPKKQVGSTVSNLEEPPASQDEFDQPIAQSKEKNGFLGSVFGKKKTQPAPSSQPISSTEVVEEILTIEETFTIEEIDVTPNVEEIQTTELITPNVEEIQTAELITPNVEEIQTTELITPNVEEIQTTELISPSEEPKDHI